MSKIVELAHFVIIAIERETDITKSQILSNAKQAEIVDARHLAIKILSLSGIYPDRIAGVFGITRRNVHYVLSTFDDRLRFNHQLRNNYEIIKKQLGLNRDTGVK